MRWISPPMRVADLQRIGAHDDLELQVLGLQLFELAVGLRRQRQVDHRQPREHPPSTAGTAPAPRSG